MWIDTHNHFDFPIFNSTRAKDWQYAQSLGVTAQFVMAVSPHNFNTVSQLANDFAHVYFALGIHPMFIANLDKATAIKQLHAAIEANRRHPRFIGIGEIGLDGTLGEMPAQTDFFCAQLKLAKAYDLAVFMHVRKAQDIVLKYCRQIGIRRGIAHAFNGSHQQAEHYIKQGFKLGFGGAFTFDRARQLRRLINDLPLEAFVLETDAPDMAPVWAYRQTNYSYHLPRIGETFAHLRGITPALLSQQLIINTQSVVPNTLNNLNTLADTMTLKQ